MTVTIETLDTQPFLYFPTGFLDGIPEGHEVEFKQTSPKVMELQFVDPNTPARSKRYKVVRHNYSAWTSIPKPWLRDQGMKKGDGIDVVWHPRKQTATLTLQRKGK